MTLGAKWSAKQIKANEELARRGQLFHWMHNGQKKFWRDIIDRTDSKFALLYTARQYGKSHSSAIYGIMHCLNNDKAIVRHIFPTLKLAKEVMITKMGELVSYLPEDIRPQLRRADSEWYFPTTGSVYKLGGADPSGVDSNRGNYTTLAILDELGFYDANSFNYLVFSVLLPQTTHYPNAKIIGVTTPPASIGHPVLTEFAPLATRKGAFMRATIYDNPLLTKDQIESLCEASGGVESNAWKREYLAEVVQNDDLRVVPEYNSTHYQDYALPTHGHAFEPVTGFWGCVVSDYGVGSRDYSAVTALVYDHINNKLVLVKESLVKAQGLDALAKTVKQFEKDLQLEYNCTTVDTVIDIMAQAALELRNVYGLSFRSPSKVKIIDMMGGFRNAVEHGRFIVSKNCEKAHATLATGLWKNTNQSLQFERTTDLGHLDVLAAIIYAFRACPWSTKGILQNTDKSGWMRKDLPIKEVKNEVEHVTKYSQDTFNYSGTSKLIRGRRF